MKKIDCAYAAGIFDGEGCIHITRNNRGSYALIVTVGNNNEWLVKWLQFAFGGYIGTHVSTLSRRPCFQWQLSANKAVEFLQAIMPYLRIKKPQAELAIQFQSKRNHCGISSTPEQNALNEADRLLMRHYKKPWL